MKVEPPKIDGRNLSSILGRLQRALPHYAPELKEANGKGPAAGLLSIYCYLVESVIKRLNQAPTRNLAAFLDMLGIVLLPAQSARVPLTFTPAKGTEQGIVIPAGTQSCAGKTAEHGEVPFETEQNLLTMPGALQAVLSVVPGDDAIYQAPPGFAEGAAQAKTFAYTMLSSAPAGATHFQLDHVTELKKGDHLKIAAAAPHEYVIVSGISGTIVVPTEPLSKGYLPDTPVAKQLDLPLFEGKNLQEHSLYLGHKELFNVKSSAFFTVEVSHRAGSSSAGGAVKAAWEYWGEVKGEEGEGWRPFEVTDGTDGLSLDGEAGLAKKREGEIKEREIGGVKSRWLRCKVTEPLSVPSSRRLPVLDKVTLATRSSGTDLKPDLVFNNDVPLDPAGEFTPFGKEPRLFDNFLLGDKEVFSKKGAKVDLEFEVAPRGVLGPPVAVRHSGGIRVFAVGSNGQLTEVFVSDQAAKWPLHEPPPGSRIAPGSRPGVVFGSSLPPQPNVGPDQPMLLAHRSYDYLSLFVRGANGHLLERKLDNGQWRWFDHRTPKEGVQVASDPEAVQGEGGPWVYLLGSDGHLYEFSRNDSSGGSWLEQSLPVQPAAPLHAISFDSAGAKKVKVFVAGTNGILYEGDPHAAQQAAVWTAYPAVPDGKVVPSKPLAVHFPTQNEDHAKVVARDSEGTLWELDTGMKKWHSLGTPGGGSGVKAASAPTGYISRPQPDASNEGKQLFVRGSDNRLWELTDNGWSRDDIASAPFFALDPFAVVDTDNQKVGQVFSLSDNDSLIAWGETSSAEYRDPNEARVNPVLSWEYWNGGGWGVLKGVSDGTGNLLKGGRVSFMVPRDIAETELSGQKSYWLRARIVGGDFGRETFYLDDTTSKASAATGLIVSTKETIRPPVVTSLSLGYSVLTRECPQQCLTYNNLEYVDESDACRKENTHFEPFVPLEEEVPTLYLGFDKQLASGPLKIFFDAKELQFNAQEKPKVTWTCSGKNDWLETDSLDATEGLLRREILDFIAPIQSAPRCIFGRYLHWLKGSLTEGAYLDGPVLAGIHPNSTWALQVATIRNEILGSGNGQAHQTLNFQKIPVLQGAELRVRELLSDEDREALKKRQSPGKAPLVDIKDDLGRITETWVLWEEVKDFCDSSDRSRHYTVDRATGEVRFGDGTQGLIPPEEIDNVKAFSYRYGGGTQGNVRAADVKTLQSAIPGIDKVANPVAADGGSDTATLEQMLEIGPAVISHRNRAVTVDDFHWLAKAASRKVVKARCLPNIRPGSGGNFLRERGCVTVVIIPDAQEDRPRPSLELKNLVRCYLEAHSAASIASACGLYVIDPVYAPVDVSVDLFVSSFDAACAVEREARRRLVEFFHPLRGGPGGGGWDFGRDVSASDVYGLLEDIPGLDHLENLQLAIEEESCGPDMISIVDHKVVAAGVQTVRLHLAKG